LRLDSYAPPFFFNLKLLDFRPPTWFSLLRRSNIPSPRKRELEWLIHLDLFRSRVPSNLSHLPFIPLILATLTSLTYHQPPVQGKSPRQSPHQIHRSTETVVLVEGFPSLPVWLSCFLFHLLFSLPHNESPIVSFLGIRPASPSRNTIYLCRSSLLVDFFFPHP